MSPGFSGCILSHYRGKRSYEASIWADQDVPFLPYLTPVPIRIIENIRRHLNCGAGRIVWQDIVRIDQTIKNNKLLDQPNIVKSFEHAKNGNGRLHFLGLVGLFILLDPVCHVFVINETYQPTSTFLLLLA